MHPDTTWYYYERKEEGRELLHLQKKRVAPNDDSWWKWRGRKRISSHHHQHPLPASVDFIFHTRCWHLRSVTRLWWWWLKKENLMDLTTKTTTTTTKEETSDQLIVRSFLPSSWASSFSYPFFLSLFLSRKDKEKILRHHSLLCSNHHTKFIIHLLFRLWFLWERIYQRCQMPSVHLVSSSEQNKTWEERNEKGEERIMNPRWGRDGHCHRQVNRILETERTTKITSKEKESLLWFNQCSLPRLSFPLINKSHRSSLFTVSVPSSKGIKKEVPRK